MNPRRTLSCRALSRQPSTRLQRSDMDTDDVRRGFIPRHLPNPRRYTYLNLAGLIYTGRREDLIFSNSGGRVIQERRRAPRYKLDATIAVGEGSGRTIDLSSNSVYFESAEPFAPGDDVPLVFPLEAGATAGVFSARRARRPRRPARAAVRHCRHLRADHLQRLRHSPAVAALPPARRLRSIQSPATRPAADTRSLRVRGPTFIRLSDAIS